MVRLRKKTTEEIVDELKRGRNWEANYMLLFERHYDQVYRFFQRKGMSQEDCRDLTQEVFVSVHKGLKGLREETRFHNWLFKITRNIFKNELGRRQAKKRGGRALAPVENQKEFNEHTESARTAADPQANPMEALLERERQEKLREAIQTLPPQMRRCVQLRAMKGLSNADTAAVMGISINTVKAHLHQARKALRERLGQYFSDMEI